MTTAFDTPPRLSIALLSACALAYEVLLTRLFSIIQFHHYAFMIISLALLGYGAAGTFLALASPRLLRRYRRAYIVNIALFGGTSLFCFLLAQQIPFNAEEVLWDPRQILYLAMIYLLPALPFFFAANAVGLALIKFRGDIARIYAADLLGAGIGAASVIALLFLCFPENALRLLAVLGLATAALACRETGLGRKRQCLFLLLAVIPLLPPASWMRLNLSPYKGLSQALRVTGANVIHRDSSPLGLLSVVTGPVIPFRHAPGLSLTVRDEPPTQLGVFTDGDGMTVINHYINNIERFAYLDALTSAVAYHLRPIERVLVLGAGGGSEVLQARYHDATDITAVELNPELVELVRDEYAAFSGNLYQSEYVTVQIAEGRGFVAKNTAIYDLIQIPSHDAFAASAAGLHTLNESYLYTVEALQEYVDHLRPGGVLSMTRWVKLPPRDNLKLFATAVLALRRRGVAEPGKHLLLVRGWQTCTLLIKNGTWSTEEIGALKEFCRKRAFDVAYYPGIRRKEVNRYNRLPQPYFYEAAQALLGRNAGKYMENYKFNLTPPTDDKPFFFHFFKWSSLREILSLIGRGGMSLLESGYLVLLAALLQAIIFSAILILLPLLWLGKDAVQLRPPKIILWRTAGFFFLIGLAFLFVEIAFIQKFILFMHHPLYAVAVVLTAFLLFAGIGSGVSNYYARRNQQSSGIGQAVCGIIVLGILYVGCLGPLFQAVIAWPTPLKNIIAILLIAPLAFCMGMPFPLGLSLLSRISPRLLPWAWGINGCASVLSAILAALLALHFGIAAVVLQALFFYGLAAVMFIGMDEKTDGAPSASQRQSQRSVSAWKY